MSEFSLLLTGFVYGVLTLLFGSVLGVLFGVVVRKLFGKKRQLNKKDRNEVLENGKC